LAALAAVESNQRITINLPLRQRSPSAGHLSTGRACLLREALMRCATWFVAIGLASLFVYLALRCARISKPDGLWDQTGRCFENPCIRFLKRRESVLGYLPLVRTLRARAGGFLFLLNYFYIFSG